LWAGSSHQPRNGSDAGVLVTDAALDQAGNDRFEGQGTPICAAVADQPNGGLVLAVVLEWDTRI